MIEHDRTQAAVLAASVIECLLDHGLDLHWVVDLRDAPVGVVSAPDPGNVPWWNELLERLRNRLQACPDAGGTGFRVTVTMLAAGAMRRVTFRVGTIVQLDDWVGRDPAVGHWLLWPQHVDLGVPTGLHMWWCDDDIPF